jgi:hypothetical protein
MYISSDSDSDDENAMDMSSVSHALINVSAAQQKKEA